MVMMTTTMMTTTTMMMMMKRAETSGHMVTWGRCQITLIELHSILFSLSSASLSCRFPNFFVTSEDRRTDGWKDGRTPVMENRKR